jgi:hypothetical protein
MSQFTYTAALSFFTAIPLLFQLTLIRAGVVAGAGIFSWWMTKSLIPKVRQFMLGKKIFGFDINKKGSDAG